MKPLPNAIVFSSLTKPNQVSYSTSNSFLIFIGIILLLALAGIIAAAVIKKIRNKNK